MTDDFDYFDDFDDFHESDDFDPSILDFRGSLESAKSLGL